MGNSEGDIKVERDLRELWERHHEIRHDLEEKARHAASVNLEQRLHSLNEIREQINSERGEFVRRDYFDQKYDALSKEFDTRMKAIESTLSNYQGRLWMIGAVIATVVALINVVFRYIR